MKWQKKLRMIKNVVSYGALHHSYIIIRSCIRGSIENISLCELPESSARGRRPRSLREGNVWRPIFEVEPRTQPRIGLEFFRTFFSPCPKKLWRRCLPRDFSLRGKAKTVRAGRRPPRVDEFTVLLAESTLVPFFRLRSSTRRQPRCWGFWASCPLFKFTLRQTALVAFFFSFNNCGLGKF